MAGLADSPWPYFYHNYGHNRKVDFTLNFEKVLWQIPAQDRPEVDDPDIPPTLWGDFVPDGPPLITADGYLVVAGKILVDYEWLEEERFWDLTQAYGIRVYADDGETVLAESVALAPAQLTPCALNEEGVVFCWWYNDDTVERGLAAFNIADLSLVWSGNPLLDLGDVPYGLSLLHNGVLVTGSDANGVVGVNSADGTRLWLGPAGFEYAPVPPAVDDDDNVYFVYLGTFGVGVCSLDKEGNWRWHVDIGEGGIMNVAIAPFSNPAIIGAEPFYLYMTYFDGSWGSHIARYKLDGTHAWTWDIATDYDLLGPELAVTQDGTVVIPLRYTGGAESQDRLAFFPHAGADPTYGDIPTHLRLFWPVLGRANTIAVPSCSWSIGTVTLDRFSSTGSLLAELEVTPKEGDPYLVIASSARQYLYVDETLYAIGCSSHRASTAAGRSIRAGRGASVSGGISCGMGRKRK